MADGVQPPVALRASFSEPVRSAPAPEQASQPPNAPLRGATAEGQFVFQSPGGAEATAPRAARRPTPARRARRSPQPMAWSPGVGQDGAAQQPAGGADTFGGIAGDFGQRLHLSREDAQGQAALSSGAAPAVPVSAASQAPPPPVASAAPVAEPAAFVFASHPTNSSPRVSKPRRPLQRSLPRVPQRPAPAPAAAADVPAAQPEPSAASAPAPPAPSFVFISQVQKMPPGAPKLRRHLRPAVRATPTARAELRFAGLHISDPAPAGAWRAAPAPAPAPPTHQQKEQAALSAASHYRSLGNDAYNQQAYDKAAQLYGKALSFLGGYPSLQPQLAPLLFCNRAAAYLATGRPLQALQDCRMGLQYDRTFAKCHLRMATCHARLGEFEAAEAALDAVRAAVDGNSAVLAEADAKAAEIQGHERALLSALCALGHDVDGAPAGGASRTQAEAAMQLLEAAAQAVPHSEVLHAARSEALLRRGEYARCTEAAATPPHADAADGSARAAWRPWIEAQAAFHAGRTDEAVAMLEALGARLAGGTPEPSTRMERVLLAVVPLPNPEELSAVIAGLKESARLKAAGNEAMKAGKYSEALEAYSEALKAGSLSQVLTSQLFANRAAAYQGLKQFALALADCARATALDATYRKAHSRRAAVLSELRLHSEAAAALQAALQAPGGLPGATRRDYQTRLQAAQRAARPAHSRADPPSADMYGVLGLQRTCTAAEVRKAYKKMALALHPDKLSFGGYTAQLSSAGTPVAAAAEAAQARLQESATWLFKCLSEACDVLADSDKRQELDFELQGGHGHGGHQAQYGHAHPYAERRPRGGNPAYSYGYANYGTYGSYAYGGGFGHPYGRSSSSYWSYG